MTVQLSMIGTSFQRYIAPRSRVLLLMVLSVWFSLIVGTILYLAQDYTQNDLAFNHTILGNLSRHDVVLETKLAEIGLTPEIPDLATKFPLFAMMGRAVADVIGIGSGDALPLVSKVAQLFAFWGLWTLVYELSGKEQADRAILYMFFSVLGTGFVWILAYPESLYLATWSWAFVFFWRKWYVATGCTVALAILVHPQTVGSLLIVLPLALVVSTIREVRSAGSLTLGAQMRSLVERCAEPLLYIFWLPLLVFVAWLWRSSTLTELPLAPFATQALYARGQFTWFWVTIYNAFNTLSVIPSNRYTAGQMIDIYHIILVILGTLVLAWLTWKKRIPWPLFLFTLLTLLLALSTGQFYGVGRFMLLTWLPLLPIYLIPPSWRWVDIGLWLAGAGVTFTILTVLILNTPTFYTP